jgi:hypothetical protein
MRNALTDSKRRLFLVATALAALTLSGLAQERDRSKIPDKYKWNLADLYPSDVAWRGARSDHEGNDSCDGRDGKPARETGAMIRPTNPLSPSDRLRVIVAIGIPPPPRRKVPLGML